MRVCLNKLIICTAEPDYLSKSTNFKPYFENGSIIVKKGKKIEFTENAVKFEDGTDEEIDTVVFWTGYQYKFPFFSDSSLIEVSEEGRYWGPLYKRIFSINDPTLIFAGNSDNNSYIQVVMEKQILVIKHFISGKLNLPWKEEMQEILSKELETFNEVGLRNYFKGFNTFQIKYIKSLQNLLIENKVEVTQMNEKYLSVLNTMIKIFGSSIVAGNFIDFKKYDYNTWIPSDFEYDTTEYF